MDINEERLQIESIRRGFAEIEAGHYIPHEAMKAWLLSLGSQHQLPPPKCVCGESHDERSEHRRG
jgi:predicted transcriptional regulator